MTTIQKIVAVVAVVILLCGMAAEFNSRDKPTEVVVTDVYIVREGDTLWSIAGEFCPAGEDKRLYIDDIIARNRLDDAVIYPGQEIEVWRYEEVSQKKLPRQ